jgi:hypothetical protein
LLLFTYCKKLTIIDKSLLLLSSTIKKEHGSYVYKTTRLFGSSAGPDHT